jgi:hypothetical protein
MHVSHPWSQGLNSDSDTVQPFPPRSGDKAVSRTTARESSPVWDFREPSCTFDVPIPMLRDCQCLASKQIVKRDNTTPRTTCFHEETKTQTGWVTWPRSLSFHVSKNNEFTKSMWLLYLLIHLQRLSCIIKQIETVSWQGWKCLGRELQD